MDPALEELRNASDREVIEAVVHVRAGRALPPEVDVISRFGEIVTARIPRARIVSVWSDESTISVKAARPFESGFERATQDDSERGERRHRRVARDRRRPNSLPETGKGVVVAILDWGFDVFHEAFLNADGESRVLAMWDQSATGPSPDPYGYGHVYEREDIDRAARESNPYAALGYHPGNSDRRGRGAHGTHVADIAAGSERASGPAGVAPEADLLLVHLANRGTEGRANLGDSVTLLEALDWVRQRAGGGSGDARLTINASVGRHGGPHTGTTLVERGIDHLVREAPGRAVVQSTGNYYRAQAHASGRLTQGGTRELSWWVDAADRTANELEVWYAGADRLGLELLAPDGSRSSVRLGGRGEVVRGGRVVGRIYHRDNDPGTGMNHVNVFLYREAPSGRWRVALTGEQVTDGGYHVWVERDSSCPGCQSRLDPSDADARFTTGTICNGPRSIAVGAYDAHSEAVRLGAFSSAGPTVDGRAKPDLIAPGVQVLAARSAPLGEEEPTDGLVRNSGTSMAAPHVTGAVALMFEAAGRPMPIEVTRRLLLSAARAIDSSDGDELRVGAGVLDVERAVAGAREWGRQAEANEERIQPPQPNVEQTMNEYSGMGSVEPDLEYGEDSPGVSPDVEGWNEIAAAAANGHLGELGDVPADADVGGPMPSALGYGEELGSDAFSPQGPLEQVEPVDTESCGCGGREAVSVPYAFPVGGGGEFAPSALPEVALSEVAQSGVEDGSISVAEIEDVAPVAFDALAGFTDQAMLGDLAESLEVVAMPGEIVEDLRDGDLLIERSMGEGAFARVQELTDAEDDVDGDERRRWRRRRRRYRRRRLALRRRRARGRRVRVRRLRGRRLRRNQIIVRRRMRVRPAAVSVRTARDLAEIGPGFVGTGFRPSRHGFRFTNSFSLPAALLRALRRIPGVPVGGGRYGLCGGMSFLAADHFVFGVPIPTRTSVPATGSSLYNALVSRQLKSLKLTPSDAFSGFGRPVYRYYRWMRLPDRGQGSVAERTRPQVVRTLASLRRQSLTPLGLVYVNASGSITQNHQVLAYGFEPRGGGRFAIYIYDPNYPSNDDVILDVRIVGSEAHTTQRVSGSATRNVRGFFVTPFSARRP